MHNGSRSSAQPGIRVCPEEQRLTIARLRRLAVRLPVLAFGLASPSGPQGRNASGFKAKWLTVGSAPGCVV